MKEREYLELSHLTRREHDELFSAGTPPSIDELIGWEFCGWNCSLFPRLAGFQKFVKGFYRRPEARPLECEGFNSPVIQNGIDGEWLGLPSDDTPKRFGFYLVAPAAAEGGSGSLLLNYGTHPANPRLDVTRLLRDLLVKVDNDPDLMLGKAHLALGSWLFAGYFLLKRRRPHSFTGATA